MRPLWQNGKWRLRVKNHGLRKNILDFKCGLWRSSLGIHVKRKNIHVTRKNILDFKE